MPRFAPLRVGNQNNPIRDVKRDHIRDWKASTNYLDYSAHYNFAQNTRILQTIVAATKLINATNKPTSCPARSKRIGRVATATAHWNRSGRLQNPDQSDTRESRTRSSRRHSQPDCARARRQWRAHRRARRVKEDGQALVGRADQHNQGRVWAKRRDGVAVRQQSVCCKKCWHRSAPLVLAWHALLTGRQQVPPLPERNRATSLVLLRCARSGGIRKRRSCSSRNCRFRVW